MTGTEDRLAQALRARTDLVTPERLTPADPPVAAPVRVAWRRPAAYVLAAAACAAIVSAIVVPLGRDGREPAPVETPTPTPVGTGAHWKAFAERTVDLDGGTPERVVLRRPDVDGTRVRVELPDEPGVPYLVLDGPGLGGFAGVVDLDEPTPGHQVVLWHESDRGMGLEIVAWVDGRLVRVLQPTGNGVPRLVTKVGDDGYLTTWWIAGGGLYSGRSVEPQDGPPKGPYELTGRQWHLADGQLVAAGAGPWCTDGTSTPRRCGSPGDGGGNSSGTTDGFAVGASPFADRTDEAIDLEGAGTTFTADLDGGGDETIRLSTPGDTARLSVRFDDGTETHVDLDSVRRQSADPASLPSVQVVPLGSGTHRQLVVRWGGPDGVPEVFDVTGHQVRALAFTSYFGRNQAGEAGGTVRSVLTTDGSFYALHTTRPGEVSVYRWEVQATGGRPAYLVLGNDGKALGTWCEDRAEGTYTPC